MEKLLILFLGLLWFTSAKTQTWSGESAAIVYNKCTKCHHDGGIAPFSLMSFSQANAMSSSIRDAVLNERMPPYPPDKNYQQYSHARFLSDPEKQTIIDWVDNGALEGNPADAPAPPVYNIGSILGNGDLTIKMPNYRSKASSKDDYVCLSIPTNLVQDRKIKALEIIPGNRETVHHCLVYVDEAGTYSTDTIGGDCGGPPDGKLLMAYTPGSSPLILPSGSQLKLGMNLKAGSNIVLAMHYPSGTFDMLDSTKVIFHFYPQNEPGIREVSVASVLENWNIVLPPNEVTKIEAQYPPTGTLPVSFSLLSVFPHMHLLGREIKAFGVNAQNDTSRYISIPDWDFHWQDFYFFKKMQKAEAGSVIKGYGIYDNTTNNPNNPNSPPQFVFAGENTSDEMFLVYFHYLLYQNGDENYDLESLMTLSLSEFLAEKKSSILVYPNPFSENLHIRLSDFTSSPTFQAGIYDLQGNLVKSLNKNDLNDTGVLSWNGKSNGGSEVSAGSYVFSLNMDGKLSQQLIIKK